MTRKQLGQLQRNKRSAEQHRSKNMITEHQRHTTHFDPTHKSLELALLDQHVAGRLAGHVYAYAAVAAEDGGYSLGLAVEGEQGYTPTADSIRFDSFEEARRNADGMNRHIGLDLRSAAAIVAATMRFMPRR